MFPNDPNRSCPRTAPGVGRSVAAHRADARFSGWGPSALMLASILGAVVAVLSYRELTPAGTTRARRGLPARIARRWLLAGAYFGADTFLPLGLTELRGLSTAEAGFGLSAGVLTWVAASALQARGTTGTARGFLRRTARSAASCCSSAS